MSFEGSDDHPTAATTPQIPFAAQANKKASQPSEMEKHVDTVIFSDDESGDSLFGSPSPSSTGCKSETQGGVQEGNMGNVDKPDTVVIPDDDDSEDSLFGDPPSDDDISDALLKLEESLQGVDTPDAMSCVLMPHQRIGVKWLLKQEHGTNKGGILADDMGLGKTIQAVALIFANPPVNPARKTTLIVAPLAVVLQWLREVDEKTKPGHKLQVHVFHGKGRQISVKQLLTYDIVLTNYESLTGEVKLSETKKTGMVLLHPDAYFHRIILDEAHTIKNRKTLVARGANRLQADYRLAMTGTPLMNRPEELYSVLRFLDIPKYNEWEYFNSHIAQPLQIATSSNAAPSLQAMRRINELKNRTMLVRKKTDLLDGKPIITLPGRTDVVDYCTFDKDELAFYIALQNKVQIEVQKFMKASKGDRQFTILLVHLLRLRQACCHPDLLVSHKKEDSEQPEYLDDVDPETLAALQDSQDANDSRKTSLDALDFSSMTTEEIEAFTAELEAKPKKRKMKLRTKAEKLEYYRELEIDYQPSTKIRKTLEVLASIQEAAPQDKVIVFSFFTSFLDLLEIGIRRAGFKSKRYDGTLNATEKDEVIREFTNPATSTKILLTSLKSGNAGLNLNAANHVIIGEPYWNPFVEQQAIDRAHRIGQTKQVYVHRLFIKNTVENRILEMQEKKRRMVDIALGTGDHKDPQQQREQFGALTKQDVFDLLMPGMELPEGAKKEDVRGNLELFSPTTKAPTTAPARARATTSAPVRQAPRATGRRVANMPSWARTPAVASVGPRGPVRNTPARAPPGRVPAQRPAGVQPRLVASIPGESSYKGTARRPENGPTDWKSLLAKHGGQTRRRFQ